MDASNANLVIGLNAVVAAIEPDRPMVLSTRTKSISNTQENTSWGLPYGAFDPAQHRTFEIGLRAFVETQTNMTLGYVEQLYTFGDKGRLAPTAIFEGSLDSDRIISVGYLALATAPGPLERVDTAWRNWYDFFPWEDWRNGEPRMLSETILPAIRDWVHMGVTADKRRARLARARLVFGYEKNGWEEERTLERYELMYQVGLVTEKSRDAGQLLDNSQERIVDSISMTSDHRRILATAIGRLRGKLKYRPIIFEMMPATFTLLSLQKRVEAIIGFPLHKQNFRRGIENQGFVAKTGKMSEPGQGRPAALFQFDEGIGKAGSYDRTAQGLTLPRLRQSPSFDLA